MTIATMMKLIELKRSMTVGMRELMPIKERKPLMPSKPVFIITKSMSTLLLMGITALTPLISMARIRLRAPSFHTGLTNCKKKVRSFIRNLASGDSLLLKPLLKSSTRPKKFTLIYR
jgi:hypothetical protein